MSTDAEALSANGAARPPTTGTPQQRERAYINWTKRMSIRKNQQDILRRWPDTPCASTSTVARWINDERAKRAEETKLLTDSAATRELLAGTSYELLEEWVTAVKGKPLEGVELAKTVIQLMQFMAKLNRAEPPVEINMPAGYGGVMLPPGVVEGVLAEMRGHAPQPNGRDIINEHRGRRGEPLLPEVEEIIGHDVDPGD